MLCSPTTRPSNIADMMRVVAQLRPLVEERNYMLSVYGSVPLRGEGRDLDLLMSPVIDTDDQITIHRVVESCGYQPRESLYRSLYGSLACMYHCQTYGIVIDVRVMPVQVGGGDRMQVIDPVAIRAKWRT